MERREDRNNGITQVYDATVAEMLLNEEDSAPIVKIIWHVAVVLGHAFTHFKDHFDASAVSKITGKTKNDFSESIQKIRICDSSFDKEEFFGSVSIS